MCLVIDADWPNVMLLIYRAIMSKKDLWVFAYGSLIWNPGFDYVTKTKSTVYGYRRSFCMYSVVYRGTKDNPGLVLALEESTQSHCEGVAYLICSSQEQKVKDYLYAREMPTRAYIETVVPIRLEDDTTVDALTYVIDKTHDQYCGDISFDDKVNTILNSKGQAGSNIEYLKKTHLALESEQINDLDIFLLNKRVSE